MKVVLKVLLSCSIYTLVCAQSGIVMQTKPVVVDQGEDARLNCTVTVPPNTPHKVFWFQEQARGEKHISTGEKVELEFERHKFDVAVKRISTQKSSYVLRILKVQPSDRGKYHCKLTISGGDTHTMVVELTVRVSPAIEPGSSTPQAQALINQTIQLNCSASGYPKPNITWSRLNGKSIPGMPNTYTFKGNSLTIKNIQTDDRGLYRCHADNTVPEPATYDVSVEVNFPAYGRPVQKTYGQYPCPSCNLQLECIVGGNPRPELIWWKIDGNTGQSYVPGQSLDGKAKRLNQGSKFDVNEWTGDSAIYAHIDISEIYGKLTIKDFTDNDFGVYVCEGKNVYNKDESKDSKYKPSYLPITVWKSDPPAIFGGGPVGTGSVTTSSLVAVLLALVANFVYKKLHLM